jgi:hypothetical protein
MDMTSEAPNGYSAILASTVRMVGMVPVRVDAHSIDEHAAEVGLTLGTVLIYMRDVRTAQHVADGWSSSAVIAEHLGPARPMQARGGLQRAMGSQVSALVRLGGLPSITCTPYTRRPGNDTPSHARIMVGPLTFEVCDWTAWAAMSHGFKRALRVLRAATA